MSHRMKDGPVRDTYMELVEQFPLMSIRNKKELREAQNMIDSLIGREPLEQGEEVYLEALSDLVGVFEDEHLTVEAPDDAAMLAHLLEASGLCQSALADAVGMHKSTISEVLSRKRNLTRPQIHILAKFFKIDAGAFMKQHRDSN